MNEYLIALFIHLQNGGELPKDVSRELYNEVKLNYINNTKIYPTWYIGAIGFLASYNGKWFDGGYAKPGYEKTPRGLRYRDYYAESKRNLETQMPNLMDVQFNVQDYTQIKAENSVIYCDPPYINTTQFKNAKEFDYDLFYKKMRELSKSNYLFISELTMPDDFVCIWQKEVNRSLNAKGKFNAVEKLFVWREGRYAKQYL